MNDTPIDPADPDTTSGTEPLPAGPATPETPVDEVSAASSAGVAGLAGLDPADAPGPAPAAGPGPAADPARRQDRIALAGTLLLVVALAFGAGFAVGRATGPGGATGASGTTALGSPSSPAVAEGAASSSAPGTVPTPPASSGPALPSEGNRLGSATAKVVIDYWADYQCPFCARFAREVIPQLAPRIADGTLALVHRDYTFIGSESTAAAVAVRCAGREGKYWPMHDAVYAAQKGENQGAFARAKLLQVGASVGVDAAAFAACLDDHSVLVDVLDDTAAGFRAGVKSTPTIDVNGNRFLGVPESAKLLAAIDAAVAGASPAPLPTREPTNDPWVGTRTDGLEAGDPAAPVTVELWIDYQAAASGAVAKDLEPELRKRVSEGKVHLSLRDLALLGDESVVAATAVRCTAAQDGPAWFVHDVLAVSGQGPGAGIFVVDNLLPLAAQLGLDVQAFDRCLADPAKAQAARDETARGKTAGLTEGPAVVVSAGGREVGRFSGTLDAVRILQAIDAAG